jgi:hypothetical protein
MKEKTELRAIVMQMSSLVAFFLTHKTVHPSMLDSLRFHIESYLLDRDLKEHDDGC